jgi:hypothetical protein
MLNRQPDTMTTASDIATAYEVMLYADVETRIGLDRRWLIAGSHVSRAAAATQYAELNAEFPNDAVNILMVASVHDAATGMFRDKIIQSRGLVPLIDRRKIQRLTPGDRQRLALALRKPERAAKPKPPPSSGTAGWVWWLTGAIAGGAIMLALLLR